MTKRSRILGALLVALGLASLAAFGSVLAMAWPVAAPFLNWTGVGLVAFLVFEDVVRTFQRGDSALRRLAHALAKAR